MQAIDVKTSTADYNPLDRVDSYLRKMIATTGAGARLPSVREVMKACSVSQAVVDRMLVKLQAEGLVESRPRSGFYRREKAASVSPIVTFLFFGVPGSLEPGTFGNEFLGYLTAKLAQRGESMRARIMATEPDPATVIEDVERQGLPFYLTYGISPSQQHWVQHLKDRGITGIHLFPSFAEPVSPGLMIRDEDVVREQVKHLIYLGHRRIAYLHAAEENPHLRQLSSRRDLFYRFCVEYNLDVQGDWVRFIGWDHTYIRAQVRQIMSAPKKPTAMIIYDNHVNPVYAELRACGFVPGKDISVVGLDDMPWAAHVEPPLTTLRVPRVRAANAACEMMEEVRAGRDPGTRYLETNLVIRQSTAPAEPAK